MRAPDYSIGTAMAAHARVGHSPADLVLWNDDWAAAALCREAEPDALFVRGAKQNKAKQLCGGCPVRAECLAEALDNQVEWGVWGGLTERERRALLRQQPGTSWRAVLESARNDAPRIGRHLHA
ncbi:hypothetical protein GCM10009843_29460 [Nocardioides bigeumensis]|uniref:Transcriptional regulator WhiB n=2 Tax=Nocardioides bigeumensis TaxID=433657 RepID=A0ABP5KCD2_9ACTN